MSNPLWTWSACRAVDALAAGELKPEDLLDALEARIDAVDPVVNALPTRCFDRARAGLDGHEQALPMPLCGLPVPIKDSYRVAGVRTTWGSQAFADHVPDRSDYVAESIERAGGIIYAKSNTPEFEAGANTFNEVFGFTRNPWNTALSAAGSSGGAAVAVATGMAFIAQGSDFACSLRYPAAFCGVVGLRPTPGVVPQGPSRLPWQSLSVVGPLARDVADLGLALDAMAGHDPGDPLTRPGPAPQYRRAAQSPRMPDTIAYSQTLGMAVVSDAVREIVDAAIRAIEAARCSVQRCDPELDGADSAFRPLRAFQFSTLYGDALEQFRDRLKPEVVWNIEQGLALNSAELAAAETLRAELRQSMLGFLGTHGFLITPTAPVLPGPVEERFVSRIGDVALSSYLDWLALGYAITITGCPAISIPCGFSDDGLPVGLQIVAPPHCDAALLSVAAWVEHVLAVRPAHPIDPVQAKR